LPFIDDRADIQSAKNSVQTATRDVTSSSLAYLPTIEAVTGLTYNSDINIFVPEEVSLSTNGLHTAGVAGAVLTVPLYDGGVRYGQRTESLGHLLQAQANLNRLKQDAVREVREAALSLEIAQQRLAAARANYDLAVEAARLMTRSFANGTSNAFDLLETQRRVWTAKHDLIVSEVDLSGAAAGRILAAAECEL
jgi:outer membrane protein TolC